MDTEDDSVWSPASGFHLLCCRFPRFLFCRIVLIYLYCFTHLDLLQRGWPRDPNFNVNTLETLSAGLQFIGVAFSRFFAVFLVAFQFTGAGPLSSDEKRRRQTKTWHQDHFFFFFRTVNFHAGIETRFIGVWFIRFCWFYLLIFFSLLTFWLFDAWDIARSEVQLEWKEKKN